MHTLPKGRILLALSGGPDSVGLAVALREARPLLAYADHRLRGLTAAREERRCVAEVSARLDLPLVRVRLRCGPDEASARRARYAALERLARKHGCTAVATAHTAEDRAETVLLQLLRGTGLRGLGSLRPAVRIRGLRRIRPALDERRRDLHARGAMLPSIRDRSNRSTGYARGRVRHLVLPALNARLGEDPVPLLCGLADAACALRETLERRAGMRGPQADRVRFLGEAAPAFAYLVEAAREAAGCATPPLGRKAYAALRDFLRAGRPHRWHRTPGGERWTVERGGTVRILR